MTATELVLLIFLGPLALTLWLVLLAGTIALIIYFFDIFSKETK